MQPDVAVRVWFEQCELGAGECAGEVDFSGSGAVEVDPASGDVVADDGFLTVADADVEAELVGVTGPEAGLDFEGVSGGPARVQGGRAAVQPRRRGVYRPPFPECCQFGDWGGAQLGLALGLGQGELMALRQGSVGMLPPYCQLFIQPIMIRLLIGVLLKVTPA